MAQPKVKAQSRCHPGCEETSVGKRVAFVSARTSVRRSQGFMSSLQLGRTVTQVDCDLIQRVLYLLPGNQSRSSKTLKRQTDTHRILKAAGCYFYFCFVRPSLSLRHLFILATCWVELPLDGTRLREPSHPRIELWDQNVCLPCRLCSPQVSCVRNCREVFMVLH